MFALTGRVTGLATTTLAAKRRSLDRQLGAILATPSRCDLTRELQAKIGRARDQHLVFIAHPGTVEPTNNGSERLLRPAVVQRKMTNGYRAMWAATGKADIRTVVDIARLAGASPFATILKTAGVGNYVAALDRYIDGFYNPRRRQSVFDFTSPTLFERGIIYKTALH